MSHDTTLRDLVFGVQALRREVERDNQVEGAFGMAAWPWPHQVAQVRSVLEDVCVRHCIADEVGLGKTIQALAVVRALLLRRPTLRVAFVVPDDLVGQWRDEALARGGFAVDDPGSREPDEERSPEDLPLLLWPRRLKEQPDLWAVLDDVEVLVVDEFPRLTIDLKSRLARLADSADHVLLLTATPPLGDDPDARTLLGVIEPTRSRLRGSTWSDLLADEVRAAAEAPGGADRQALALVHAAGRRLLRARRSSWREQLPSREVRWHEFQPTAAEVEREQVLWRWLRVATDTSRDFDKVRLAQRVRSVKSLSQRATFLKGQGHEREGLIARIQALLSEPGDSRFEALCDVLNEVWREEPDARVLIGANDNLTVDDLEKRLPKVFDGVNGGAPLKVACIRNQKEGPGALVDPEHEVQAAVRAFKSGEAQVLLLTDDGVAGLNLQVTRHVIFYAVSWDPIENEQLLGRVDRIGNQATFTSREDDAPRPIVAHLMVQRGSVDERICGVMSEAGLLEVPLATERADVKALAALIAQAGLSDARETWQRAAAAVREVVRSEELSDARMPLRAHLPSASERARAAAREVLDRPAAWPALVTCAPGWPGWSDATRAWLAALAASGEYKFSGSATGRGEEDFGYAVAHKVRHVSEAARRPVPSLPESWHTTRVRTHRNRGEVDPPMRRVRRDGSVGRRVVFFDHGADLHEELVAAWGLGAARTPARLEFSIMVAPGKPLAALRGAVVALVVGRVEPTALLQHGAEVAAAAREADQRFLRARVPSRVVACAFTLRREGEVEALDAELVERLLGRGVGRGLEIPRVQPWLAPAWGSEQALQRLLARARAAAERTAAEHVSTELGPLRNAVRARAAVIDADASELEDLARRGDGEGRQGAEMRRRAEATRRAVDARIAALEEALDAPGRAWSERAQALVLVR